MSDPWTDGQTGNCLVRRVPMKLRQTLHSVRTARTDSAKESSVWTMLDSTSGRDLSPVEVPVVRFFPPSSLGLWLLRSSVRARRLRLVSQAVCAEASRGYHVQQDTTALTPSMIAIQLRGAPTVRAFVFRRMSILVPLCSVSKGQSAAHSAAACAFPSAHHARKTYAWARRVIRRLVGLVNTAVTKAAAAVSRWVRGARGNSVPHQR